MTKFQTRSLLVVALAGISLGLLLFSGSPALEPVRSLLQAPLATLQRSVAGLWRNVSAPAEPNAEAEALRQRLATLEAENAQLREANVRLQENETELQILAGLLEYARSQPENKYLTANLIGRDPSPFLSYLIFDRGSNSGVTRGMPVVTGSGLVGRVVEVTNNACKVLPITDPSSAVNARLQKSRASGVIVGQLGGGLEMQFITQQAKIEPGEVVLTSGLGGAYPAGIVIGSVNAVEQLNYEVQQKAEIVPAVDYTRLEIVLIITNFQPADFSPFFQATPTALPPAPSP